MAREKLKKKAYKEFKYAKKDNSWAVQLPCGNVLYMKAADDKALENLLDDLEKEKDKIKNK